jgi:hypothetical protein
MTLQIAMDARPGGPATKREPSPEGLGTNPKGNLSAVGAALNRGPSRTGVILQFDSEGGWRDLYSITPSPDEVPSHPAR